MEPRISIGNKLIGDDCHPYVIAEIGSNHNGDMSLCKKIIDSAVLAGVDAVKFQSWSKESLISKAEYARNTSYTDKHKHFGSLAEMVEQYAFTRDMHYQIADYCQQQKVTFLSSAFSPDEVNLLEELNVPAHKVASMDINYYPLLRAMAATRKPVILSTGMASLGEIEAAIQVLREAGSGPIVVLHCISIYPPKYNTINLNNIPMLRTAFDVQVGFSDHSIGTTIPLAAIALGACVIEKHFTIDKHMPGWDHAISADHEELATIVTEGRHIKAALGSSCRVVTDAELEKRKKFRRSIVINRSMQEGDIVHDADLTFKRPGTGIPPTDMPYVVGRKLKKAVDSDHELQWNDLVV